MRKIKFRAWHRYYKVMVPWERIIELFEGFTVAVGKIIDHADFKEVALTRENDIRHYRNINIFWHADFITLQYTGLEDKNGKEICEGDVIRLFQGREQERIDVISWNEYTAKFMKEEAPSGDMFGGDQIEVIGNIYENPELVK